MTLQNGVSFNEPGHKHYYYDSIKELAKKKKYDYNKAKDIIDAKIADYIHENISSNNKCVKDVISGYAHTGYKKNNYTEIIAECFNVEKDNVVARKILKLVRGEMI